MPPLQLLSLAAALLFSAKCPGFSATPVSIWGTHNLTEYIPGTCNLVITAPHGGAISDDNFEDRRRYNCYDSVTKQCNYSTNCRPISHSKCRNVLNTDSFTAEITRRLAEKLTRLNCRPHVVLMHLRRAKIDANRATRNAGACQNDAKCVAVYSDFHAFINRAQKAMPGPGLLLDIHGQGHAENWTELGYRIGKSDLNGAGSLANDLRSSVQALRDRTGASIEALIRGDKSLGGFLAKSAASNRIVPSPGIPRPNAGGYYRGGYITETYGSIKGGCQDAIQVEVTHRLRLGEEGRAGGLVFAENLAVAVDAFMREYRYFSDGPEKCPK